MSGDPRLLAVGLASPATRLSRDAGLRLAARISPDADRERLAELYANAGVSERGSILGDGGECADLLHTDAPQGPTTAARLARYRPHAVTLAGDASTAALARAERPPEAVTHLITVSCTGAESPGLDHALIDRLGLRSEISRTHVGFMGCHGAINGLALADAFVRAHDGALAMVVCVEVCSLHFQAQAPWDQQVANAIFADGAACAVVGGAGGRPDAPRLRAFGSRVFPGTRDLMSWTIGEHGFEMRLSPRVPGVLRRAVGPWTDQWLGALKLSRADIAAWAVHPGGRDILTAVERGLGLPDQALDASRAVLDRHGNMSSGTVLWVLDALLQRGTAGLIGALSFGPGLTGEGVLIEAG
jgi:predicted naringenin-chalcone synthase